MICNQLRISQMLFLSPVLFALLVVDSSNTPVEPKFVEDVLTLGILVDLSGLSDSKGQQMAAAIHIAIDDFNSAPFAERLRFNSKWKSSGCNPGHAVPHRSPVRLSFPDVNHPV